MARIAIVDFAISDRAESKMWAHGVTREQILQLLRNRLVVVANRKNRAAGHVVIGRDDNDRCIAIPVLPTDDPAVWRPITAWYCKPGEIARLR
jgi:hypothetical protein